MRIIQFLLFYYYDLFDRKIADPSIVVGMISLFIIFVGFIASPHSKAYKTSVLEYGENKYVNEGQIIYIQGKKYKIIFEELPIH